MSGQPFPRVGILAPIARTLPPLGYGPWELVAYTLAEELTRMGVDVTVFAVGTSQVSGRLSSVIPGPTEGRTDISHPVANTLHIVDALRHAGEVDIIHNHFNVGPAMLSTLIATPMVTTLHAAGREAQNQPYFDYLQDATFISLSQAERAFQPNLKYVSTVYNGVDFDGYILKEEPGEYLIFTGRVVKEKGILAAIALAKEVGLPLRIAGIIPDEEFYRAEIQPLIDGSFIQYVGNLPRAELASLLSHAVALVALMEWNDACPLSVLDALASGVPVIASRLGALPEMVQDGVTGILVDSADEAARRLPEVRAISRSGCREAARSQFSKEVMAAGYMAAYRQILAR